MPFVLSLMIHEPFCKHKNFSLLIMYCKLFFQAICWKCPSALMSPPSQMDKRTVESAFNKSKIHQFASCTTLNQGLDNIWAMGRTKFFILFPITIFPTLNSALLFSQSRVPQWLLFGVFLCFIRHHKRLTSTYYCCMFTVQNTEYEDVYILLIIK